MSDTEIRERILEKAREHFLQFGFSTVTMSEIATDLGMSKKTVYAHFTSKEDLAAEMVKRMQAETSLRIELLVEDRTMDFIQKLRSILDVTSAHHTQIPPHLRMDLLKHAPNVCKCSDEFQEQHSNHVVARVIQEGVERGVFRANIDQDVVTALFIGAFQHFLKQDPNTTSQRSVSETLTAITSILFEGILTNEARAQFINHESRPVALAS